MLLLSLQTFWHSSAHVLGEVLELDFGVDLTIGPALEEGFYYDCYMGEKVSSSTLLRMSVGANPVSNSEQAMYHGRAAFTRRSELRQDSCFHKRSGSCSDRLSIVQFIPSPSL